MSGRTVRATVTEALAAHPSLSELYSNLPRHYAEEWRRLGDPDGVLDPPIADEVAKALGLDPDTPFDPARQRLVVVDVCDCEDGAVYCAERCCVKTCRRCDGRGVRWTT